MRNLGVTENELLRYPVRVCVEQRRISINSSLAESLQIGGEHDEIALATLSACQAVIMVATQVCRVVTADADETVFETRPRLPSVGPSHTSLVGVLDVDQNL